MQKGNYYREKLFSSKKPEKKQTTQHIRIFLQLLKENKYYKGCQKYMMH